MKSIPYVRVLLVIIAFVGIAFFFNSRRTKTGDAAGTGTIAPGGEAVTVTGAVGGEKLGFISDPEVVRILHDKYGVTLSASKAGSIEMAESPAPNQDFIWPSSQVAGELYKENHGKEMRRDTIFSSPVVLYSWAPVVDKLMAAGVVTLVDGSYYIADFPKLLTFINSGKKWKDIGLTDLYGRIGIRSTDPNKSNSGMMFAGLLANTLNNDVATDSSLAKDLPIVKTIFGRLGYMEGSSGDLFDQFVTQGEGQNPIIVGYENQLTEYTLAHPEYASTIQSQIRIVYPRPTVWSDHPLIAITPNGVKLLSALRDDMDLKRIAWEGHGFRTGLQNDPKKLANVTGVPAHIQNVVAMPRPAVMKRIIAAIGAG